ncbi:MAG: C13 family peptidase [Planctomycetota bacterium]|jgi:hypothetical protein
MSHRRTLLVPILLLLLVPAGLRSDDTAANPADLYAILVEVFPESHPKLFKQDPVDLNGGEIAMARIYGVLKGRGFDDANITVFYHDGKLEPDWTEKKAGTQLKMLRENQFKGKSRSAASPANVMKAVNDVKAKLDDNDQFVFWMGVHGAPNGTVALKGGMWSVNSMHSTFSGMKSKTNIILTDSCYSGQIVDKINIDNAVIYSTTQSNTTGCIDRNHSGCADFMECKADDKFDKDRNGFVCANEAFDGAKGIAEEYKIELNNYLRKGYKQPRRISLETARGTSLIPKMKVGSRFKKAALGVPGKGGKAGKSKKKGGRKRSKGGSAEKLMKQAELWESGQNYVEAIECYRQVAEGGSEHADDAKKKMEELLSDPEIAAAWEKHEAEEKLDEDVTKAREWLRFKEYEKAIECAQKVVDAAPDSKQAKQAKKIIRDAKKALGK